MSYIPYGICLSLSGFLDTKGKSILVAANGIISLFLWLSSISLCVYTTSSLSIHLLMGIVGCLPPRLTYCK